MKIVYKAHANFASFTKRVGKQLVTYELTNTTRIRFVSLLTGKTLYYSSPIVSAKLIGPDKAEFGEPNSVFVFKEGTVKLFLKPVSAFKVISEDSEPKYIQALTGKQACARFRAQYGNDTSPTCTSDPIPQGFFFDLDNLKEKDKNFASLSALCYKWANPTHKPKLHEELQTYIQTLLFPSQ